jgi:glycerol-3-phosphate dehydrogenase
MVALAARPAADRGAVIRTRVKVTGARRENGLWHLTILDTLTGRETEEHARLLVNAAGPWVDTVLVETLGRDNVHNVRLVQGSHIVIRRKFEDPRAYFFQNRDGRIIFAIPYEEDFTLIGTTDRDYHSDPHEAKISDAEIDYLCAAASEYFAEPVRRDDIVWTYSAVRPLFDDGASKAQEATRDYVIKADAPKGEAPLVNSFGGKITTFRRLSETVVEKIGEHLGARGKPWTADAPLPGGDFPPTGFDAEVSKLEADYPFLDRVHARRLIRLYGTRARKILGLAKSEQDLGRCFGADLYEAEIRYLMREEWALTAEDVLWRRTKRGLRLSAEEATALSDFMRDEVGRSDLLPQAPGTATLP